MLRSAVAGAAVGLVGATSLAPTGCCVEQAGVSIDSRPRLLGPTYRDNVMQWDCEGENQVHHLLQTCDQVRCPGANQKWNDCGSACPPTCGVAPGGICTLQCVIGCGCKPGFKQTQRGRDFECVALCPGETAAPTTAEPTAVDVCSLRHAVTGPCRAAMPMWTFNPNSNACERFIYGGCQGNANKFGTEEECQAAGCVTGCCESAPVTSPLFPAFGTFRDNVRASECTAPARMVGVGYTHHAGKTCDKVRCPGANQKWNDCGSACPPTCGIESGGLCTMQCVIGCGCEAGFKQTMRGNNFECVAPSECPPISTASPTTPSPTTPSPTEDEEDVCSLPPAPGVCRAAMRKWYYDAESNSCQVFIWGGCEIGSNANRFDSQELCQASGCVAAVAGTTWRGCKKPSPRLPARVNGFKCRKNGWCKAVPSMDECRALKAGNCNGADCAGAIWRADRSGSWNCRLCGEVNNVRDVNNQDVFALAAAKEAEPRAGSPRASVVAGVIAGVVAAAAAAAAACIVVVRRRSAADPQQDMQSAEEYHKAEQDV